MCGIFGIIKNNGQCINDDEMQNMHIAQRHRGPDHFGYYQNEHIFLGNNRLSIIDLDSGNQPFYSVDKQICVLQNGEIFNYVELKSELRSRGIVFSTESDTEVILKLYEEFGISMIEKLNGMFSIVILDLRNNKLFLIRDRFGQKPLFYFTDNKQFVFSSEIKSILELGINTTLNFNALRSFLRYNFVAGKESIFKNVKSIDPGNYISLDINDITFEEKSWWDPISVISQYKDILSNNKRLELVKETVYDSIKIRMRSDVDYSAFLSGGIDSSIIVSQMNQVTSKKFNTFTIGFEDSKFDESQYANEVANQLNVNHRCEKVSNDILGFWDEVLNYTEQPHGDVSFIPMFLLSKFASERDRVVLTGDGADEIFGGYSKYSLFEDESDFEDQFRSTSELFSIEEINELIGNSIDDGPDFLSETIKKNTVLNSDILESNQNKAMYLDTIILLPYNNLIKPDRMGMAHSVELRSPFLDYRVISLAFAIKAEEKLKNNISKYILKEAFKDDIPSMVYRRDKQKFIVPLNENKLIIQFFYDTVKNSELLKEGVINKSFIDNLYLTSDSHNMHKYRKLRALTALVKWYDIYAKYF